MADYRGENVSHERATRARVLFVTTCRSDYGPAYWVLHDLFLDPSLETLLAVSGAHLSEAHGLTVSEIERDGWPIAERLQIFGSGSDRNYGSVLSAAVNGFTEMFDRLRPAVVVVLGDRIELLAIATAAVVTRTPLAHLCGGDITEGALDEQVRHAVTKVAHLHFPATSLSARRVLQMGEEPWRVTEVGDPALDHFRRELGASENELAAILAFRPNRETLLVTQHPLTVGEDPAADARAVFSALDAHAGPVIVTAPAPDPGSDEVRRELQRFVAGRTNAIFVENLGSRCYRGLLQLVGAMVGNSSSGLIEAASAGLPVVNVGRRQEGRQRNHNVIDVAARPDAIRKAITRALTPEFRWSLSGMINVYGDGTAGKRIVAVLRNLPDREKLLTKRFVRLGEPRPYT